MSNETFRIFPSDYSEALAILYLQNQDLNGKTPSEIHTMYRKAIYEIREDYRNKNDSGWFRTLKEPAQS